MLIEVDLFFFEARLFGLGVDKTEPLNELPFLEGQINDILGILGLNAAVEDPFRFDPDERTALAETLAAAAREVDVLLFTLAQNDVDIDAGVFDRGQKRVIDAKRAVGDAAGVVADDHAVLHVLGIIFEFFDNLFERNK